MAADLHYSPTGGMSCNFQAQVSYKMLEEKSKVVSVVQTTFAWISVLQFYRK